MVAMLGRQISIDVPRMSPLVSLFQQRTVQENTNTIMNSLCPSVVPCVCRRSVWEHTTRLLTFLDLKKVRIFFRYFIYIFIRDSLSFFLCFSLSLSLSFLKIDFLLHKFFVEKVRNIPLEFHFCRFL